MMNIIVVEDQALVLGAICSLLSLEVNIQVIGQAQNGEQALELLNKTQPDIILTDIEMPKMSGLELAQIVQQTYPQIKVAIMTTFSKSGYIKRALDLGVKAFILKEAPTDYLVSALIKISQGGRVIDPELALMALDDHNPLSDKESKAIKLASEGLKTAEIADKLYLSQGTVRNYLSDAIAKLNAVNRVDAARIAKQKGWI
ncbi:response regulator transcription factor [Catenovulum sp. 2E275]|uniref:response regulator transcription factor n=1 Tax=Catenovulum sp. 2E275 TaxID=2980497 RepID=UPI0021D03864|nr:response regulator transcription factor [Catenovulum sp. 2E275]MCU4675139.1 response regulator transcription factor [Catenovulum sp. 2E275]